MPLMFSDFSEDDKKYASLMAQMVDLLDVKTIRGEFHVSEETREKTDSLDDFERITFNFAHIYDEEPKTLHAKINIKGATPLPNETKIENMMLMFNTNATFVLSYQLKASPPPEDVRDAAFFGFIKLNGLLNVWPYYREFAMNMAKRAELNVITPLLLLKPNERKPNNNPKRPAKTTPPSAKTKNGGKRRRKT